MTLDDTLAWSWVLAMSWRVGVPGDEGEGWRFLLVSNGVQRKRPGFFPAPHLLAVCSGIRQFTSLKSVKLRS